MKTYKEKLNKLSDKLRKETLNSLATSEYGQAIREELVDLINETSSVLTIEKEIINGEPHRLAIEVVAKDIAASYLEGLYKRLIPTEEKAMNIKTHK